MKFRKGRRKKRKKGARTEMFGDPRMPVVGFHGEASLSTALALISPYK